MSGVDAAIAVVVLLSVLQAAAQGFFHEVFALAGVVFGYLLAVWEYPRVAAWYLPMVRQSWVADIAGFLTIFVLVIVVAGIAGRITRWAVKEAGLQAIDRVLGAAFGLVRGILLVAIVLLALTSLAPVSRAVARSALAPYLLVVARAAIWAGPSQVRTRFYDGIQALKDARDKLAAPGQQQVKPSGPIGGEAGHK